MRYVLPGLATLFLLVFFTYFSDSSGLLQWMSRVSKASGDSSMGVVVAAFLASGALGYVLSTIYWTIIWLPPYAKRHMNNDLMLLRVLNENISIVDVHGTTIDVRELDERGGWEIVAWWLSGFKEEHPSAAGQSGLQSRLVNINHCFGTTIVGSTLAFLGWAVIQLKKTTLFNSHPVDWPYTFEMILLVLGWACIITMLIASYKITRRSLVVLAHTTFANEILADAASSATGKVRIPYVRLKP